jgi:hypothetical protein
MLLYGRVMNPFAFGYDFLGFVSFVVDLFLPNEKG